MTVPCACKDMTKHQSFDETMAKYRLWVVKWVAIRELVASLTR